MAAGGVEVIAGLRVLVVDDEVPLTGVVSSYLVREGFDPTAIADPLYVMDPDTGAYESLISERHTDIIAGRVQF